MTSSFLDQNAVTMVDLMLNDLCRPAGEGLDPGLKGLILPPNLDGLIPAAFPGVLILVSAP